jgi:hypothetical protein
VRVLALVLLAGCLEQVDPRWSLDHDHVIAVRATPAGVAPGEHAAIDALIAHAGAPATVASPSLAGAPAAPPELQTMVARDGAGWTVTAPIDVPPTPIDVVMMFDHPTGDPFYVKKTVVLGEHIDNPMPPAITVAGAPAGAAIALPVKQDVYLAVASDARVSWLTSCGTLYQDDVATSYIHADAACDGELAVVVRADDGGVAWQVLPLHAR